VPFSAYLVNRNNRRLRVRVPGALPSAIDVVVSVDTGDYTAAGLADAIELAVLQQASVPLTVTYDAVKDGYVFTYPDPFELDVSPEGCNALSTLGSLLGLPCGLHASALDPDGSGNHVLRSAYRKNFDDIQYLVLEINLLTVNQSLNPTVNKSFAILHRDPNRNAHDKARVRKVFNPPIGKFDRVQVTVRDRYGNLYDFQNQDHHIELLFESHVVTRRYR
jgi:hypothetical protein